MTERAFKEVSQLPPYPRASARSLGVRQSKLEPYKDVDVEVTNLTIILEHVQLDRDDASDAEWMYSDGLLPFLEDGNSSSAVYAPSSMSWNANGAGNGTCFSGGSGRISRGYLDPFNFYLNMTALPDFDSIKVELRNLSLTEFEHVNTVRENGRWDILGEAGDSRRYSNGTFTISDRKRDLVVANNLQWVQNLSYPRPVGESPGGSPVISGYFIAEINNFRSDDEWVSRLDPHGMGYVLGILTAASFGPIRCITANSYWISLRGFPDLRAPTPTEPYAESLYNDTRRSGAKNGEYFGSNETEISTARGLANFSRGAVSVVMSAAVAGAAGSAAAAVVAPTAITAPPGQGMFRLVTNTAFVAKINEIYGFHSEAMEEFGDGLKPFIGKLDFPFSSEQVASTRLGRWMLQFFEEPTGVYLSESAMRQEDDGETSVTDALFGGCAFYTTIIIVLFFTLHFIIWLVTRRKPMKHQLGPHAWMIYIFSIIMSYIYTASVLNSMQYLRSHLGKGTGKPGLIFIAFMQLIFIGIGFTAFFLTIMYLAVKRVRKSRVKWVPRKEIPDPDMRNKSIILGEYQPGDENVFHTLFECYYSSLAGTRVWLAGIELTIIFLDAVCTATIWNEVICLTVLICVYSLLFLLFLTFAPYVDKIEGRLVTALGFIDLLLLIIEFIGALGNYETAERMEFIAMILGFVSIGFAVLIAVYCDLIPIILTVWGYLRRKVQEIGVKKDADSSEEESEWSLLSESSSKEESDKESEDEAKSRGPNDVTGFISSVVREIGPQNWFKRRSTQAVHGDDAGGRHSDVPSIPHSPRVYAQRRDARGSNSSLDTIEWPKVGQVIYSVEKGMYEDR